MVPNGQSETQDATTRRVVTQVNAITNGAGFTCGVDTGQILRYSVTNADVTAIGVRIDGYWETFE